MVIKPQIQLSKNSLLFIISRENCYRISKLFRTHVYVIFAHAWVHSVLLTHGSILFFVHAWVRFTFAHAWEHSLSHTRMGMFLLQTHGCILSGTTYTHVTVYFASNWLFSLLAMETLVFHYFQLSKFFQ